MDKKTFKLDNTKGMLKSIQRYINQLTVKKLNSGNEEIKIFYQIQTHQYSINVNRIVFHISNNEYQNTYNPILNIYFQINTLDLHNTAKSVITDTAQFTYKILPNKFITAIALILKNLKYENLFKTIHKMMKKRFKTFEQYTIDTTRIIKMRGCPITENMKHITPCYLCMRKNVCKKKQIIAMTIDKKLNCLNFAYSNNIDDNATLPPNKLTIKLLPIISNNIENDIIKIHKFLNTSKTVTYNNIELNNTDIYTVDNKILLKITTSTNTYELILTNLLVNYIKINVL